MGGHYRSEVIKLAKSWVGKRESDQSHRSIIDIYNTYSPLPRGLKMQYNWSWCAATWSALFIQLGYTDIAPIEMSCGNLITLAKKMGIWEESDGYIPSIGDGILYDWDDTGIGDCTGWPDHIGTVEYVNQSAGYFTVIEGNYSKAVKRRNVQINSRYIRGFICPRYDREPVNLYKKKKERGKETEVIVEEVIAGLWGSGTARKANLEEYGYNYEIIQNLVNIELQPNTYTRLVAEAKPANKDSSLVGKYKTIDDLNMRSGAGTNKASMIVIPKGSIVHCNGEYTRYNGLIWLYVSWIVGTKTYTGFCSQKYLN